MSLTAVILAAGQGSRMNSDLPKVLHPLAGVPMIAHALAAAAGAGAGRIIVVAGHGIEAVRAAVARLEPEAVVVEQAEQRGTGHAVAQALPALPEGPGDVLVLYGDTPFVGAA
ncbi:MAG: NTP transferase domain-containing protein, partial [Gemmobacter sp.]